LRAAAQRIANSLNELFWTWERQSYMDVYFRDDDASIDDARLLHRFG